MINQSRRIRQGRNRKGEEEVAEAVEEVGEVEAAVEEEGAVEAGDFRGGSART